MKSNSKIHVGIGFVTGRKNFKHVLKSYLDNWNECSILDCEQYALHLFIAYDLNYSNTTISDYHIIEKEILETIDSVLYINNELIKAEAKHLMKEKITTAKDVELIFGEGYAMKRNAVLYSALKAKMDYLIFLDDDEYPIANLLINGSILWKGQHVLTTHIQNIKFSDMTHGYHCGYISPIPRMQFNQQLSEKDFRQFIETVSNDIITWDSVKKKMANNGITYANLGIINRKEIETVKETDGMKFISGANLGFNLKSPAKLFPFYNPPGARGEDTFLSTCIVSCNIRKVPCYTFHDGFLTCQHLLSGVLPNKLEAIDIAMDVNYKRFLKAAIGWIRYKPLLTLITKENYEMEISETKKNLAAVIPKLCNYFGNDDFKILLDELDYYDRHVHEHFKDFEDTKNAWLNIVSFLTGNVS